jgi:hypothetical protein
MKFSKTRQTSPSNPRFPLGTKVRASAKAVRWWREHLLETFSVPSTNPPVFKDYHFYDMLMWAMSDVYRPEGIVDGFGQPDGMHKRPCVHVEWTSAIGNGRGYHSEFELNKMRTKKKRRK